MGMRIDGGHQGWYSQNSSVSNWQQRQQNFKALGSSLQSGDLAGAQQAFASLLATNPAAASNPDSPLAQIGQALQSGNLAGAQQAAQSMRGMHGMPSAANQAKADQAASAFLKTLTPVSTATASTNDPAATTSATPTFDQISKALMAFEKNLFDSLQAESTAANNQTASSAAPSVATDPSTTSTIASASDTATPAQNMKHHHHHDGGGDAQLVAELNALIAQTASSSSSNDSGAGSSTASAASSSVAANSVPTSALDDSFKNLLSTLGVTGNNASLNSFLQAMSAKVEAS